ncbi:MazG-like family protein [Streptomyces clavifer]|uniref:MazG-like family protein n=1 Tax=Streptomyces clavifer TaxID=68188 RepID=UPI0033AE7FEC
MNTHPWDTVDHLHAWLDSATGVPPEQDLLLRMLKLSEEVGEVSRAVIGATGQNPRKGVPDRWRNASIRRCPDGFTEGVPEGCADGLRRRTGGISGSLVSTTPEPAPGTPLRH